MSDKAAKKKSGGFQSLGLSGHILGGILKMGYKVPTPIQRKALPIALAGKDLVAMARTGSGKTAAFLIPILERLKEHSPRVGARALVLSPTRELAMQTAKFLKDMAKFTSLRYTLLVGGDSMDLQFEALTYNPDIIVATPGRLMHHLMEVSNFSLSLVEVIVFDEADRLFELGFAEQLREIMSKVSPDRQTMLFSATMPHMLVQFTRAGLRNPEMIRLDVDTKISDNLRLAFFIMRQEEKLAMLVWLMRDLLPLDQQSMVFCATRQAVDYVTAVLRKMGVTTEAIYGSMEQTTRTGNLAKFRLRKCRVLVVTDVASRGIDVPLLDNVVNFDCPDKPKLFVHRTGRVARQGRIGTAFTFLTPSEMPYALDLHLFLSRTVTFDQTAAYTLNTMSPNDVHCGAVPRKLLDAEMEGARSFHDTTDIQGMAQTATNSYKMYNKTRADASKRSVLRSKELELDQIHPLFSEFVGRFDHELDTFRKQLAAFRPHQVILEVEGSKKDKSSLGDMMKRKRERDEKVIKQQILRKQLATRAAGGEDAFARTASRPAIEDASGSEGTDTSEDDNDDAEPAAAAAPAAVPKYLKRALAAGKKQKPTSFRDDRFFIAATPNAAQSDEGLSVRESHVPSAMRSGLSGAGLGTQNSDGVAMLEDAALDMMPDETTDMFSKRRVMHWDRRKKKFVQISAKESADAHVTGKRIRNESGAVVTKTKQAHGEMYKKWQKSSKRRVEAVGGEETVSGPMSASMDWRAGKRLRGSRALAAAVGNVAPAGPAGFVERRRGGPDATQELKTKHEVVKQRKTKLKEKRRLAGGARREDAPPKSAKGGDHKAGKFGGGKKGFGGAKRGRK